MDTDPARTARFALGTAFTGAGIAHVIKHEWFENLVPASMAQWRKPISAITAAMQMLPTLPAAVGQINTPDVLRQAGIPPALAPVRVVVQTVVAALTLWATRPPHGQL